MLGGFAQQNLWEYLAFEAGLMEISEWTVNGKTFVIVGDGYDKGFKAMVCCGKVKSTGF